MKKNNKGFMLVEVIVTSTVIVTTMIGLYTSFNRLYINYKTRGNYYNIDAVYATKLIFDDMLKTDYLNKLINEFFESNSYGFIVRDESVKKNFFGTYAYQHYSTISYYYDVKNMVVSEYDKTILLKLKDESLNESFKEYIDYVISYYNVSTSEEYSYLLLTEIYDENSKEYYYANLRVR